MDRNEHNRARRPHAHRLRRFPVLLCAAALLAAQLPAASASAQTPPTAPGEELATLGQSFTAAWARQPEAQSLAARRDAADARRQAAASWLVEAPALELSGKSDRATGNDGNREYVAGIALPLWLPGERDRAGALAEAEARAEESRADTARLRTAALVRDAWWAWQRARGDAALAQDRLANAKRLADDVAKRVRAGDMARADQHQADGALATAEAALAEARAELGGAAQQLRALTGRLPDERAAAVAEALPALPSPTPPPSTGSAPADSATTNHPALAELFDRAEVARRNSDLANVQTRANPELTLQTTHERSASGESWDRSITVGVRIPFGAAERHRAKVGLARAEAIEAEESLRLERERLAADLDTARLRLETATALRTAAEQRSRLAAESRGFFERSFRLGETDLPTRLRIELEASEAERQAARARIDHAATVSALRQTLGLLPEQY